MKGIKIMGLAVLTALALVAVPGVASASSGIFTAEGYPASIVGEATGSGEEAGFLTAPHFGGGSCPSPVLKGTLAGPSETVTLPATLSEKCTFASSKCEFKLHPISGSSKGTIDIVGCSSFEGTVAGVCHVTVTPKKGVEATFENQGSGSSSTIKVHINATGLEYFSTNCNPKGTVYTDGSYTANWIIRGEAGGKSTGIATAEFPGFSVIGGGSEYAEFHSGFYPATIGGEQTSGKIEEKTLKKIELVTAAGAVKCNTATFSSPYPSGQLEDASELLLSPTSKECTLAGTVPVTVTPTAGCTYNSVLTGSAPYVGSLFLCETKIAAVGSKCTITVANQTHSGMEYANVGSGSAETVEAKANLSGLEYQIAEGNSCPNGPANGSYSDGKYKGVVKLNVTKVG